MTNAYINVIENEEQYHPEAYPGSEEQVLSFSKLNWDPISTFEMIRTDYPMSIKVSEIEYTHSQLRLFPDKEKL